MGKRRVLRVPKHKRFSGAELTERMKGVGEKLANCSRGKKPKEPIKGNRKKKGLSGGGGVNQKTCNYGHTEEVREKSVREAISADKNGSTQI